MQLDTENTIYVCTDRDNGEVKLLMPRRLKDINVVELNLSNPDPDSTDAAEYKLLSEEMDETTYEI